MTKQRRRNTSASAPLKILDGFFVLFRSGLGFERAEVTPFPGFRVLLPRIEPVPTFNFSDHRALSGLVRSRVTPPAQQKLQDRLRCVRRNSSAGWHDRSNRK